VIEAKIGSSTSWALTDVTNATKYSHMFQQFGLKAIYRVRAHCGTGITEPSNEAVAYVLYDCHIEHPPCDGAWRE
jgi:hypothetical protein